VQSHGDEKIRLCVSAAGNRKAQPNTNDEHTRATQSADASTAAEPGRRDTRDTHLCNCERLVVQQVFLPQVDIQRGPAVLPIVNDPIGGRSGGCPMCGLEPIKVVFYESFEDEGHQFKTSCDSKTVEGHNVGGGPENKKDEGTVSRTYSDS